MTEFNQGFIDMLRRQVEFVPAGKDVQVLRSDFVRLLDLCKSLDSQLSTLQGKIRSARKAAQALYEDAYEGFGPV